MKFCKIFLNRTFQFDDDSKICTWPSEIKIPVENLEMTSETLNDVFQIRDYIGCLWRCTEAKKGSFIYLNIIYP